MVDRVELMAVKVFMDRFLSDDAFVSWFSQQRDDDVAPCLRSRERKKVDCDLKEEHND